MVSRKDYPPDALSGLQAQPTLWGFACPPLMFAVIQVLELFTNHLSPKGGLKGLAFEYPPLGIQVKRTNPATRCAQRIRGGLFFALTFSLFTFSPFHLVLALPDQAQPTQSWQTAHAPNFIVQTASSADQRLLPEVFEILQKARKDLLARGLNPPLTITVVIHPTLESYTHSTHLPWFILAAANREKNRIDTQRLRIVIERGSLEHTLRHELFHLAQPTGWPRWKAEGMAMRFTGEKPTAKPLEHLSEKELERILANPPNQEMLGRAMATAYAWATR